MKYILKRQSPIEFEEWKKSENPQSWGELKNEPKSPEDDIQYYSKEKLRKYLLEDQGFICCYCQQRILNEEKTIIEHFFPRNGVDKLKGKLLMFDFSNLLVSCSGGQYDKGKVIPRQLYCDKEKKEFEVPINPIFDKSCAERFKYVLINKICQIEPKNAEDKDAKDTIKLLNLDTPRLRELRGSELSGLLYINPFVNDDELELIPINEMEIVLLDFVNELQRKEMGEFPEFCMVKLQILNLLTGR